MSAVEQLYSHDMIEIVLDLPVPTSTNAIWRSVRGRVIKSDRYCRWLEQADVAVMASGQFPRHRKIRAHYTMTLLVDKARTKGDLSNKIKALEDWLVSRDIVRDDIDCQEIHVRWASAAEAPAGCRVTLRSLHGEGP